MENRQHQKWQPGSMLRLAVLASGGGSNLQSILDASDGGRLGAVLPVLVVADRVCGALDRARSAGIEALLLDRKKYGRGLSAAIDTLLTEQNIDIVALAGWLSILDSDITREWEGRMVNIHPSLLPRHGGEGMYGHHVHEAVLKSGDKESGCTVHLVSEKVDHGKVLGQLKVPVLQNDTPESLAARVLIKEHELYPQILSRLSGSVQKKC